MGQVNVNPDRPDRTRERDRAAAAATASWSAATIGLVVVVILLLAVLLFFLAYQLGWFQDRVTVIQSDSATVVRR